MKRYVVYLYLELYRKMQQVWKVFVQEFEENENIVDGEEEEVIF